MRARLRTKYRVVVAMLLEHNMAAEMAMHSGSVLSLTHTYTAHVMQIQIIHPCVSACVSIRWRWRIVCATAPLLATADDSCAAALCCTFVDVVVVVDGGGGDRTNGRECIRPTNHVAVFNYSRPHAGSCSRIAR